VSDGAAKPSLMRIKNDNRKLRIVDIQNTDVGRVRKLIQRWERLSALRLLSVNKRQLSSCRDRMLDPLS
jgi:hypothetical protein